MKITFRNPLLRQYGGHSLCVFAFVAISLVLGVHGVRVTPLDENSTVALYNKYYSHELTLPQGDNLTEILSPGSNQNGTDISTLADSQENELIAITSESSPLTTTITPTTTAATEAATTTTTTPQRPLTEAELKAKAFLAENNATLEASKLDLHKVRTRAVLEFLETFILELEAVQHNMTQLLSTPIEAHNFSIYRAEEDALEIEMTALEGRLTNKRAQLNKYSAATRNAERQFRNLHQTLAQILAAQFPNTTDIRSVLGIVDRSPDEIREFLRESLHGQGQRQQYDIDDADSNNDKALLPASSIPKAITEFITSLQLPENRNASYLYILQELRKNYRLLPPDVHKGLMFHMVKDVYQFPEFEELKSPLPEAIQLLLKNEPRAIKTRRRRPQAHLYIDSHNNLVTRTSATDGLHKIWKLLPIEDGKYYLIAHEPSSQIIGIQQDEDSGSFRIHLKKANENFIRNSFQNMEGVLSSTRTSSRGSSSSSSSNDSGTFDPHDTKFHWDVKIVPGEPMSFKFINMDFNLALGWSRAMGGGPVSLEAVSIYSSRNIGVSSNDNNFIERWELE